MYGFGLIKGLTVTMKNMVLPSRMFPVHQFPDRKIGVFRLAQPAHRHLLTHPFSAPTIALQEIVVMPKRIVADPAGYHEWMFGAHLTSART